MQYWKLGCRWGSKAKGYPLFYDFLIKEKIVIGWIDYDYGSDSRILLTDGYTPIGVAVTVGERNSILDRPDLKSIVEGLDIPFNENIFFYKADIYPLKNPDFAYKYRKGISQIHQSNVIKEIKKHLENSLKNRKMNEFIELLKYKKQIILQGPPGTGKTRKAKEIANKLVKPNEITDSDIQDYTKVDQEVVSKYDKKIYTILKIENSKITLQLDGSNRVVNFDDIKKSYSKYVSSLPLKGGDTYSTALAIHIFNQVNNENVSILQFHPSYTYEDFVRGITTQAVEGGVEYRSVDKALAEIANRALRNYEDSQKRSDTISKELEVREAFNEFKDRIEETIDLADSTALTDKVHIVGIDNDAFRYKGKSDGWSPQGNRMKFKDIIQAYIDGNVTRQDIKKNQNLSGLAIQHASYFVRTLNMFQEFLEEENISFENIQQQYVPEQNYVLIIDEINRANLSSVLGELIYALEYRGQSVDSMYMVDGESKITLPSNLYIIGTMNTADRSVGHIDYAIRRRFAFADVLPKNLMSELGEDFKLDVFLKVTSLFVQGDILGNDFSENVTEFEKSEHMTVDFEPKDVWLGHSYFIQHYEKDGDGNDIKNKPINFDLRIKYEIKPILFEYIKDGILKESAKVVINQL